jgi:hypothetical protein
MFTLPTGFSIEFEKVMSAMIFMIFIGPAVQWKIKKC